MRALWVVVASRAFHTAYMTGHSTVHTFVKEALGLIGIVLVSALPYVIAQARETDPIRTVDVTLSRFAFSPERIEVRLGEPVRLNVASSDGTHGFQVKALGLNVRTPARGTTVTVDLVPTKTGTFQITCSEYCGSGHSRMKGWLTVVPVR